MTEELNEYYNTLVFKDNAQTKYFFDIYGVTTADDGTEIQYPVVTISQNRKNATGADVFKTAVEQLEKNQGMNAVLVKEYSGFYDDAEPVSENTFPLKKNKKMKKSGKKNLPQQQQGSLGAISDAISNFGSALGLMGFQGGLSGIITASAQQIATQDRLETANQTIADLKAEKLRLEGLVENLKEKNEELKDSHKKIENEMTDLKRDFKFKENQWQHELSFKSLGATALFDILGRKFKVDEKLAGLLSDETPVQSQPQPQPQTDSQNSDLNNIQLTPSTGVKPEVEEYLKQITTYLKTLDKSRMAAIAAICQYTALGDIQLKRVYKFVLKSMSATSESEGSTADTPPQNTEVKPQNNGNNDTDL